MICRETMKRIANSAVCLCLLMGMISAAQGQSGSTAAVRLDGRKLFDIGGSRGVSGSDRAAKIVRRLETLINRPETIAPPTIRDSTENGGESLILFEGDPILTVTEADAQDHLTSRRDLAVLWSERMADAAAEAQAARKNPLTGAGILVRNSFADLIASMLRWLPRLAGALVLSLLFSGIARLVRFLAERATNRPTFDPNLRQLTRSLAFYGTWTVGSIAILSTIGMESGSIATTLGVSGFVLGFAFKDILSHLFAGLMLLIGRQLRIGDQIMIKEYEGTVERIELRVLHLRTADNRLVMIPNGDVLNSVVLSNTANATRRRDFTITIRATNDIVKAQELAQKAVSAVEGVLAEPAPDVIAESLTMSGVVLRVRFYMESTRLDMLHVIGACLRAVLTAYEREGITFAQDAIAIPVPPAAPPALPPKTP